MVWLMVWLPNGGKISKMRLFVSTEYTNVTDSTVCGYAYRVAKIVRIFFWYSVITKDAFIETLVPAKVVHHF